MELVAGCGPPRMSDVFDRARIRHAFGRAASGYEATAVLQREVGERLLEQLEYFGERQPARILDVGAGTGLATAELRRRYRRAQVVALDAALPMLRQARQRSGWLRPFRLVAGEAERLPFADASFDLVFSNLCLQWVSDLDGAFAELRRMLRPDGLLLLTSFGPDTLHELRDAFAQVDDRPHVSPFADIQQVGDAMMRAGFVNPVLDQDTFTLTYPDVRTLMHEIQAIGAGNALMQRRRTLTGKSRFARLALAYETYRRGSVLPSTWQVIYAHGWGPQPGAPRRGAGGEIATFPADRIGVRRRGDS